MNTWTGNIGLVNVSDVLKASTNPACTSATDQYNQLMDSGISTCNSNYLLDLPDQTGYWTINNAVWESAGSSYSVWLQLRMKAWPDLSTTVRTLATSLVRVQFSI